MRREIYMPNAVLYGQRSLQFLKCKNTNYLGELDIAWPDRTYAKSGIGMVRLWLNRILMTRIIGIWVFLWSGSFYFIFDFIKISDGDNASRSNWIGPNFKLKPRREDLCKYAKDGICWKKTILIRCIWLFGEVNGAKAIFGFPVFNHLG